MPFSERGFRPKTSEELREQLSEAQSKLGGQPEYSLPPNSSNEEDILKMPLDELKRIFARRYEIYKKILQSKILDPEEVVNMKKWLSSLNSLDAYVTNHETGKESTLREGQIPVFVALRNFIEEGGKQGYIELPTGVGKTVLFTEMIEALDLKTLVVVPTSILIEQTEDKFKEFAPDVEVGKIYSFAKEHNRQVTIITYQSLINQLKSGNIKPEEYDCLILDEAHVSLSEKRAQAINQFKNALTLGFTASPEYSYGRQVSNLLPKEIHRMGMREAVEKNLISSFSVLLARTDTDISNVPVNAKGNYSEKELEKAINIAGRNQAAVDLYKQAFADETGVVYCLNIKHAEAVAQLFNEQGVSAAVISRKTPRAEQKKIREEFKQGKIKILCNVDILTAGFDEPRASVCLNLRPTRSRVIAAQRGGRVLRLYGDKHATIIDFVDQGIDEAHPPVLYSEIVDGAEFIAPKKSTGSAESQVERERAGRRYPIVNIPGLRVISNSEEVMRVTKKIKEDEIAAKKEFLSYEDLQAAVVAAGIKGQYQYTNSYKSHPGWPSTPFKFYKDRWQGWAKFLEKTSPFLTYEALQAAVNAAGLKNGTDYINASKQHPDWPSTPRELYSDRWEGWEVFFGREKKKYLSFEDLKSAVRVSGINTQLGENGYQKNYKKHPGWPATPSEFYSKEWKGWPNFFGRKKSLVGRKKGQSQGYRVPFEDFKKEFLASGITSVRQYRKEYKQHLGWPASPEQSYSNDWLSWNDLFGKKEN